VRDVRDLSGADTEMVNTMQRIGLDLLRDQGGDMTQVLTGFHWPIHLCPIYTCTSSLLLRRACWRQVVGPELHFVNGEIVTSPTTVLVAALRPAINGKNELLIKMTATASSEAEGGRARFQQHQRWCCKSRERCSLDEYAGWVVRIFCSAVQKQGMEAVTERHDTKAHSCRNRRSAANLSQRRSRVASDWSSMEEEETNGSLKVCSTPNARFELDCQEHGDSNKHLDCTCTCWIVSLYGLFIYVVAHLICNNLISTFFYFSAYLT